MKKAIALLLTISVLFGSMFFWANPTGTFFTADAASVSLADLKSKFPQDKYWNHYVSSTTECYNYLKSNGISTKYDSSVSSSPCASHENTGYSYYVNKYDCNRFNGASQCCGFAQKLAYVAYNSYCTAWSKGSLSSLKPGDVIHYYGDGSGSEWGHWVMVTSVSGKTIKVGECNWGGKCRIRWDRSINTGNFSSCTVYSAPWTLSDKSSESDPTPTIDSRYPVPFNAYTSGNDNVTAYDGIEGVSVGRIYSTDDCTIEEVYVGGWCKVNCPWSGYSNGRTVYTYLSNFLSAEYTPQKKTAPQYALTYIHDDMSTNIGWIDAGDTIYIVGTSGNKRQIIYPKSSNGWRCGWIYSSALDQPSTESWPVFICRTISTEKVKCYNEVGFSSSPGNIYPTDDCVITAVYSNGKVQCKCPWSDGTTKIVYVNKSVFINSSTSPQKMTAPGHALTYLRNGDTSSWGWIDAGDTIYKLGESGSMTQIIYPCDSDPGMRCGWVYTPDLKKTYTVSYNANGGTDAPSAQTKTHDVNLTLSSTVPKKAGYTFVGWSTSSSATSATYMAGSVYSSNSSVTLYAVWKANQYNITYNANGGTGAPDPQTKTHAVVLKLSDKKPERIGYTFKGWSQNASSTTATYAAGANYSTNASVTLYAVWEANKYTISFDANGGSKAPAAQIKTYGQDIKLSESIPERDGYTFKGWSQKNDATEPEYAAGDNYYYDSSVTLYAVWEKEAQTTHTPGDINADGLVNNKDLTRLLKYLSGEDVEVVDEALDINGDGNINNKDLTRLLKYLAGENAEIH